MLVLVLLLAPLTVVATSEEQAGAATTPLTEFGWDVRADAYVDASKPTTALGQRSDIRTDGSPRQHSYLQFVVSGIGTQTLSRARLQVKAESSLSQGFEVRAVSDQWSEYTITYATAPPVGELLGTSGPVVSGSWVEVPLGGLVTGDGTYAVALTPLSDTGLRLAAQESGSPARLLGDARTSFAWPVAEDAYVDETKPTTNLGSRTEIRTDASPKQRSFLRFKVTDIGTMTPRLLSLRVHASSALAAGFEVRTVSGDWSESTLTHATAPQPGNVLAVSGPVAAGSWVEVPLRGFVRGEGTYDLALTPLSNTGLRLDARESGTPAELVTDMDGWAPDQQPVADDVSVTTDEDTTVAWVPVGFDVESTDVTCSFAPGRTVALASDGATVARDCSRGTFTPRANATGTFTFTYWVSDGELSDSGTVTVQVRPVNDAPIARSLNVATAVDAPLKVYLRVEDVDSRCPIDVEVLAPEHGRLSPAQTVDECLKPRYGTGSKAIVVTYTPPDGWTGTDTFSYLVRDPEGLTAQGDVTVEVRAPGETFAVPVTDIGWVDSAQPDKNFVLSQYVNVDASPQRRAFLRFPVIGLGSSPPSKVTLRIYAETKLPAGVAVHSTKGDWEETSVTWANAPAVGERLATSGQAEAYSWLDVSLPTSVLSGDGILDVALIGLSNTNTALRGGMAKLFNDPAMAAHLIVTR